MLQRALDVGGLGDRHRLDGDGRVAADRHVTHHDLAGLAAGIRGLSELHGRGLPHVRRCPGHPLIGSTMSRYIAVTPRTTSPMTTAYVSGSSLAKSA